MLFQHGAYGDKKPTSTIEYATAPTISGGLVYKGVKIAPVIPDNANIGDIVPWKVVAK